MTEITHHPHPEGVVSDLERVLEIISNQLGTPVDGLPDDYVFLHHGCDQIDMVEICLDLEDEFDISIPDDEFENWRTVADAVASVQKSLVSRSES